MEIPLIIAAIQRAHQDVQNNIPGAQQRLLSLSYKLSASIETPAQSIWKTFYSDPLKASVLRTASDLDIFSTLKSAAGPVACSDLAAPKNASPALVRRLVAFLVSVNVIAESGVDQYVATPLSDALTEAKYKGGIIYGHDVVARSTWQISDYLRDRGYQNPADPVDAPLQEAFGTKEHFFPFISKDPLLIGSFNDFMGAYRDGKESWLNFFPFEDRVLKDANPTEKVLVDVGGGLGHDLTAVVKAVPDLRGRVVLQDREEVIAGIQHLDESIEKQAHDFFTPQAVKAKAYYLHSVLHDWDDESCVKILQNLMPAMGQESKILIHDLVMSDKDPDWSVTAMDLAMMALGSVKERTESEWRALVGRAGLKVNRVYSPFDRSSEWIIEAGLP
ncbi:S-adenosyl-L-methionine-dependent methyltransferase [Elsinoe ampelina]|uniref:S-adenosyl-L-methionine-dependent methyltransferase n=1 Tax=Elsinoe ampelina TaxID=302913 RepID=A0A6A6GED2_9PEZI|nr:S-adenosyl-L-methionine-dependent methyltransferase [Elsinoe ampelina]